ncbi:14625_t:CDS:2 [Funneliformis mosseae]|uniref:14625_t:CDS:1 n=1 Tax=Funneliformis mosseae TaxID=27381 RepID=A0A9N9CSL3_FUNMO|nr:14625_t:CDS:2 [Funneliformis mosseae]
MEDEIAELSSVWRKRFLTALKEINNDDMKDKQAMQELEDIISPKTMYEIPERYYPLFLANSPIGILFFFELLRKLIITNASFWKKLKMEKNRKLSEANLHHKKKSIKSDEETIAKLLVQILQNKSEKAGSLKCQSEIDFTQDEDQRILEELTDFAQDKD